MELSLSVQVNRSHCHFFVNDSMQVVVRAAMSNCNQLCFGGYGPDGSQSSAVPTEFSLPSTSGSLSRGLRLRPAGDEMTSDVQHHATHSDDTKLRLYQPDLTLLLLLLA